jgi:hypothetical protein
LEEFLIGELDKKVRVGSHLDPRIKKELVSFHQENNDVFTWSHEDMQGIAPSVIVHKLNADPSYKSENQKRKVYSTEKRQAVAEEVRKLCEARFIKEVQL